MGSSPSIPQIDTQSSTGSYSIPDTSIDMQQIMKLAFPQQGAPPSSTVVTAAQAPVVHVPQPKTYTPRGEVVPFNDSSQERNRAHRSNTFREITNAVGAYAQKKSTERTDALKTQISSVLAAQKRIAEAQMVLQNDPNNANAKAVLDSNKKIMEGILGGKDSKAIQKAFDISFTDPSKNKTPEVKAMQEAMKEHATNHAAGHDINNPQEQQVAEQAGGGGPQPQLHQRPNVPLNPTSNTQNVIPAGAQVKSPTVPQDKASSTPYAEQFLGKQALELQANPQYAAYKEQADKQQAEAAKLLPTIFNNKTKEIIEGMRQDNANGRAANKILAEYKMNSDRIQAQLQMQRMRDSSAFSRVVRQGQDAMARAVLKAETTLGVSNDPRIKGTPLERQLQMKTLSSLQNDITKETSDLVKLQQQYEIVKQTKPEPGKEKEHAEALENVQNLIKFDQWNLQQLVDNRQKFTEQAFGKASPGFDASHQNTPDVAKPGMGEKAMDTFAGMYHIGENKNGNVTKPTESARANQTEVVGNNESDDESEDSSDIDPDNYDQ